LCAQIVNRFMFQPLADILTREDHGVMDSLQFLLKHKIQYIYNGKAVKIVQLPTLDVLMDSTVHYHRSFIWGAGTHRMA